MKNKKLVKNKAAVTKIEGGMYLEPYEMKMATPK